MTRALIAAILIAFAAPVHAEARDLTVALVAGGPVQGLRQTYILPFLATGTPVVTATRQPGLETLRDAAARWDVVQLGAATLAAACQAGLVEKLDWGAIGGRDRILPQAATECGQGAFARATVLSWDREKFPGTPTWQDFWDIAKVPGKRGLRRSPRGTLEIALLGDGVAPNDVYRLLRTEEGSDRAFRRLDQLAPYIVWWDAAGRDGARLLTAGEVLMTSAPSQAIALANRGGAHSFGLQWAGELVEIESWAIVKGSPNHEAARRFLDFAGDPKVQARLPAVAALGAVAKGAQEGLSPEQSAVSPTVNSGAALFVDEAFWRENGERLGKRFDTWVSR
ncbi:ABC transporter, periplasmic spermidine putrescine-binding protein potD (TC_3.A.1.11.1) [Rhodovastum atsumiense]|uniref:Extracellular solute-binding protein n=1 Tax=Rhodovastum atsumiense TaxID=504468 RepID=A0A5M6ITN2_9PROT|nr:extracellular solute-binding protein [Rhodovastum atsumiense]KAA5611683.1 extracellular solute-binding protein [Rhodovastum atsumiense]CAH2604255.1 ABC transporter, periplasmic spermidine putrescine-binding protein potD (TC_3.A.1.11.1) [Rhodovastum atsumiense]